MHSLAVNRDQKNARHRAGRPVGGCDAHIPEHGAWGRLPTTGQYAVTSTTLWPLLGPGCLANWRRGHFDFTSFARHALRLSDCAAVLPVGLRSGITSLAFKAVSVVPVNSGRFSAGTLFDVAHDVCQDFSNVPHRHPLERLSTSLGCYVHQRSDGAFAVAQQVMS